MISSSGDILNLILAISIAAFTAFLCWLIFTVTMILRRVSSVFEQVESLITLIKEKIDRAEKVFTLVEEKLKSFGSFLPIIVAGVNQIIGFIKNRKNRTAKK